ncbi:alpha/beta hydrolase [Mesorhizobium onobrychidis]|uniref:Alpha/beta hydrolase n=1 Tax=Mesorhizobium onobrychidis TaxID=2775404 RepID=A0ABY5R753_9HYPH|nr:alpha/beta hydrolase [Mesorhizobium onobrychidis]UVC19340.1 hypothetical protein IHQ72_36170 [Mesorhizobium onobrychidis]
MASFSALNYANVGPGGTFRRSGNIQTRSADIDAIFAQLSRDPRNKLAIHFHGGLIDEGSGLAIARKLAPVYEAAGSHPVTIIWETGLVETITRNLTRIHKTKLFQKLVAYVLREVSKRLGGGIGGKGPGEAMAMSEIEVELARIDKFDRFDPGARGNARLMTEADVEAERGDIELSLEETLEADNFPEFIESGQAETEFLAPDIGQQGTGRAKGLLELGVFVKLLAKVAYASIMRFVRERDHGLYPTVVEEVLRELYLADFGAWVWSGMKDVGAGMWAANQTPINEDSHVGAYFLDKLAAYQAAHSELTVDVVGHSAGAIAICHMFRAAAQRHVTISIRNVIFLAPACTTGLFLQEIVSQPERYAAFRMFTMADAFEVKDQLVPGVYTRSLLYFISGVLEGEADAPLAGLARHLTGQPPYGAADLVEIATWLSAEGSNHRVLSVTDDTVGGLTSTSTSHGDFDDDVPTLESLKAIIAA